MNIKKRICTFGTLKKVCVLGIYLQVFARFLVVFCQCMHKLQVYARIGAANTYACLKYVQKREIRANTD